ncbi:MAG TPA: diaminopimelate decarboxylase [Pirellulaceae bacterium]
MLTQELAFELREAFGTPLFVYDEATLRGAAQSALAFPNSFGLTVRYAMKANPQAAILRIFDQAGLHLDASSAWEARRGLRAGIVPRRISLSSQELSNDFADLVRSGVLFVATSLHQLRCYGEAFPGTPVAVRFNPGVGSGKKGRTNVGGPAASFGIWHEWEDEVRSLLRQYQLALTRIHTHIGSGVDPDAWRRVADLSLGLVEHFPSVTSLDLGGGFRVARMPAERSTDLTQVGSLVRESFHRFAERTGRSIHLEIEPGTWLVAQAGVLLATVQDIVATGPSGHTFLRLDAGMTEILRPCMYGAQHPMRLWTTETRDGRHPYVVVGHCCESGDILTTVADDPTTIEERWLPRAVIGDILEIGATGAYCASMSAAHYNSFPMAAEVLLSIGGAPPRLVRRRGSLDDIIRNELPQTED